MLALAELVALSPEYKEFRELAQEKAGKDSLLDYKPQDYRILLLEGATAPPPLVVYKLSREKQITLREYIKKYLTKGYIRPSDSSYRFPIVLVKKGTRQRVYVDYRKLNAVTKKNVYLLPRISELKNRL